MYKMMTGRLRGVKIDIIALAEISFAKGTGAV